jgi:ABC-type transporter MlaC component
MSPLKKEAKSMSEEDQKEYLKAFEKYVDKKPFDVPVKMTKHD